MKYKMICIDLDGTLLNDKHEISVENKRVLREVTARGIHVVLTTGRLFSSGRYYAHTIGIASWVISSNGAYIKNIKDDTRISNYPLDSVSLDNICSIIEVHGLSMNFNTFETVISNEEFTEDNSHVIANRTASEELKIKLLVNKNIRQVYEKNKGKILKILLIFKEKKSIINNIRTELKALETVDVVSSSEYNLEIMSKGVSKAQGVKTLAEFLGISSDEIICIGDSENDMSMLAYAGLAVAMGNASEEIKKVAHYITDTNVNDGVAKAIRKCLLG